MVELFIDNDMIHRMLRRGSLAERVEQEDAYRPSSLAVGHPQWRNIQLYCCPRRPTNQPKPRFIHLPYIETKWQFSGQSVCLVLDALAFHCFVGFRLDMKHNSNNNNNNNTWHLHYTSTSIHIQIIAHLTQRKLRTNDA